MYIVERWHHWFTSVKNVFLEDSDHLRSVARLSSNLEDKGTWFLRNVCFPVDIASHPWRLESSGTPLREPQISLLRDRGQATPVAGPMFYTKVWNEKKSFGISRIYLHTPHCLKWLGQGQLLVSLFSQVAVAATREISFMFSMGRRRRRRRNRIIYSGMILALNSIKSHLFSETDEWYRVHQRGSCFAYQASIRRHIPWHLRCG